MNVIDRIASWIVQRATYAEDTGWLADWLRGGSQSATGISISALRAMQETTCMACVLIRAGDLSKCPVHVYRLADDGEQVIFEGAAERLLRRPNSWQTPMEFFEQMQASLLLRSNAYAPVIRNGRGEPVALIPVNPDRVQIYDYEGGDVFYRVTSHSDFERSLLAGLPEVIPAADMFHLRGLTLNGITGLSRIWMMREALGLSLAQEQTAAKFFANGAMPSIALSTEKNVPEALADRLQARFAAHHAGMDNVGKMLLLSNGIKPVDMMMKLRDAQYAENRKAQMEMIAMGYEVPKQRLGLESAGDPLKAHQLYLNNTIATDAARWQYALNRFFGFDGMKTFVEFELDQFNLADPMTRVEMGRVSIVGSQISPNEWRRSEGKGPKPGGDDLFRPMNVVPAPMPAQMNPTGPGSDTTGVPAPGGDGDPNGLRNGHDASQIH